MKDCKTRDSIDAAQLRRFLRCSHIFSAAVREVMEEKYLAEVSPHYLTQPQFHLLKVIALEGKHQVRDVAEFLGVSSPAATKNIDKLERLGLVARTPSKGDRRATLLTVSPKGRRLVRRYEALKADRLSPVLTRFRPREIEEMSQRLERFSVLLFDMEKSGDRFCLRCAAYGEEDCPIGGILGNCPYRKIRSRDRGAERSEVAT